MGRKKRRTLQYAPADNITKVQRAFDGKADAVILDLESTVDVARKDEARENINRYLKEFASGQKEVIVRINSLATDCWLKDLEVALSANVETIRLPKVEKAEEVKNAVMAANQLTDASPEFLLQLESPRGILNGDDIAIVCAELPQVTGIGVGIGDYTKALGLQRHTPELRTFLLNLTAAYAEIGNMDPLAYVHKDLETLRNAAETARSLGHIGQPVSHTVETEEFTAILNDIYPGSKLNRSN